MRNDRIIVSTVFFLLSACITQVLNVEIDDRKTDMPVKVLFSASNRDSTKICLLIPQELKFKNNFPYKIEHSQSYLSVSGGSISGVNPLYQMLDSLVRSPSRTYQSGEEILSVFYAGYFVKISNFQRDSLISIGNFSQLKFQKEIYDIGNLEQSKFFLNEKVHDSLKGFIRLDFYNPKVKEGFNKNIPIKF